MARHPFHLQEFVPTPTPAPPRRLSASFFPPLNRFYMKAVVLR